MSRFKYTRDSQHTKAWPVRVGNLIVNFSAVEMEACMWLMQLTERFEDFYKFVDMPFAARVAELKRYVAVRATSKRWQNEANDGMNRALHLAKLRNRVAHSPIMFGWYTPAEDGPPDLIGMPQLRGKQSPKEMLLSAKTIDKGAKDAADLAQRLASLRIEWCELRGKGKAPEVPENMRGVRWYWARVKYALSAFRSTPSRAQRQQPSDN